MPRCSIIIPVFNQAGLTRQCLEAIFRTLGPCPDHEVIVVDNASSDGTASLLEAYAGRICVLRHETNQGFARACNAGAASAAGDYLLFLNNDTIPLAGWLDALLEEAALHPVAVIGAKLLYPDDSIQHAGMAVSAYRTPLHVYRGFPAEHPAVNKSRRFRFVTGACLLVPRPVFEKAGGFDTAFLNGYEDVDLCLRLGELGHPSRYCHRSVLYHFEGVSDGRFRVESANAALFARRWTDKLQPDEWLYYFEDGLLSTRCSASGLFEVSVAPELGIAARQGGFEEVEQLLQQRADQVHRLLRDNVALRTGLANRSMALAAAHSSLPRIERDAAAPRAVHDAARDLPWGVNLLGLSQPAKGMGQAARCTMTALEAASIPFVVNHYTDHGAPDRETQESLAAGDPYAVNLCHVNADATPILAHNMPAYFENRVNVGYWNWELTWFPPEWAASFAYYDEIWTPSRFTQAAVAEASPIPVQFIPFAVSVPQVTPDRARWRLPEGVFTFLFAFDFHSYIERKNPFGLVEAFRRAFGDRRDVLLVLKAVHGQDRGIELLELQHACDGAANIRILQDVLGRDDMLSLMQSCDAYAALHRAEGFGLLLAEAMALGRPVVATGYSANVDFMSADNSLLVRYQLAPIERDHGPYRKGALWAEPDLDHAAEQMRRFVADPEFARDLGSRGQRSINEQLNPQAVGTLIAARLAALAGRAEAVAPRLAA